MVPTQADLVSDLFEQFVREQRFEREIALTRDVNRDGTVCVQVKSPDSVIFSSNWSQGAFEQRLQSQVDERIPGATVWFEWGYPDEAVTAAAVPAPPPVDWEEFTPRLATVLHGMSDGAVVSLTASDNQCVQFLRGWICSIGGSMTPEQERLLAAAGWEAPAPSAPNWHCELAIGKQASEQTADRATEVMTQVLGIRSPAELTVEAWNDVQGGYEPAIAVLGLGDTRPVENSGS
ncbi:hypothetical protein [Nocardia sp. NPDC006630]|uniref:TY-Chap domain-containing protein n=1 Tax=Nocardia sp. NPDC006630 TaxID=3157181 RepID=UPI0033A75201